MKKFVINIGLAFRARSLLFTACFAAGSLFAGPAYADGVQPAVVHDTVYVAMGDSYSAGSGIPPMVSSKLCGRSAANYAHQVAQQLGVADFRDVTCGGAKVADLSASQTGQLGDVEAPQYNALTNDTTLVTVGIGGNDLELVQLALRCFSVLQQAGNSCAAPANPDGGDAYIEKINRFAATYGRVIEEIRHRAPIAEVLMVGYPTVFRSGGCPSVQPITTADANYLEARIEQLNEAMEKEAATHGAWYVDLTESTLAHDLCAAPDQRWLEGLVPSQPGATPLHPTAAGHVNAAAAILAAVRPVG